MNNLTNDRLDYMRSLAGKAVTLSGTQSALSYEADLAAMSDEDKAPMTMAIEGFKNLLSTDANSPVVPDVWIPAGEQLPPDSQWCVVNTEYGYYVQCWSNGQGWLGDDVSIPEHDVTHWMPIPAAPQHKGE